jgi:hypothetical protein
MSTLIAQRPSDGLERRVAQPLNTQATLPGPSRRITVEPLTVPRPAPYIPTPAPLEEPRPVHDPTPVR